MGDFDFEEMLHWIGGLIVTAILAVSTPQLAHASEALSLRETPVTTDETIRLGDIFNLTGPKADIALLRSPKPGRTLSIAPDWLAEQARQNGLDWTNAEGVKRVSVTYEARAIDMSAVKALIRREAGAGSDMDVVFANSSLALYAPPHLTGAPIVESVDYDARSGRFTARIVPAAGTEAQSIAGRLVRTTDLPVLTAPVARGEIITADLIDFVPSPSDRLATNTLTDPDQVIGFAARRALRPGEPIRTFDVTRPTIIERGEELLLEYKTAGMRLSVRARALQDGAADETIRVVNLVSNTTLEARVTGPGHAVITR